ncbi:hypothetical protein GQ457_07G007610 [Hibiscus cannabinus]
MKGCSNSIRNLEKKIYKESMKLFLFGSEVRTKNLSWEKVKFCFYEKVQEVWELEEDRVKGLFGKRNMKIGFHKPSLARNHK